MERRSRRRHKERSSIESEHHKQPTPEDLEDFRQNELAKQFDAVKSIEVEKQSASELKSFTTAKKIVKVMTMIVVFVTVLTATVVSKVKRLFHTIQT